MRLSGPFWIERNHTHTVIEDKEAKFEFLWVNILRMSGI